MKSPFSVIVNCLLTLIIISSGCKSLKEPDFRGIENIRLSRFGLNESTLNLDLHYFNPNKFKLKLKYAEGDAWINNNLLGHFIMDTLIKIPVTGDFRLPVTLQVNMKMLLQNSAALMISKEIMLRVEGKARAGKGGIFINYPIRYEGKQRVDSLMQGLNN